jgi:hypothetical protein
MAYRELQLDPSRLSLSEAGIEGYYLPVGRPDIVAVRDRLVLATLASAREAIRADPQLEPLASSAFYSFIVECLSVIEASLLFSRTRAAGGLSTVPKGTDYWQPIASGRAPDPNRLDGRLGSRLEYPKRWKAPLRALRNLLVEDGIERIPFRKIDLAQDIVATSVGELISKAARIAPQRVAYLPLSTWFDRIAEPARLDANGMNLIDAWVENCREATTAIGETLPAHLCDYLRDWLVRFFGIAQTYWRSLLGRPELLPRELWIGAASRPLLRLLSYAVRRQGGTVVGYDHATGHGHLRSEMKALVDFWTCDRFVTFTEETRRTLTDSARHELILHGQPPAIVTLGRAQGGVQADAKDRSRGQQARCNGHILHIMYVSGVYRLDRPVYMVRPFALTLLDWQARLLGKLRRSGYEVTLKAHPDSLFAPPSCFRASAHVELLRFEQVADRADLFLFDNPLSTAFGYALKLSMPVVFIDFGLAEFTDRGRELLSRRCAIVDGRIDADNRWTVDWGALLAAIRQAPERRDFAFVETYLQAA